MRWLIAMALLWGIACAGISLGLSTVDGVMAQLIFMPFALFGGIGIGFITIWRQQ